MITWIDIAIAATLLYIAINTSRELFKQRHIFEEYNLSKVLMYIVYIYPAGPILLGLPTQFIEKLYLYPLVSMLYLPHIFISRNQTKQLDISRTDKVQKAQEALFSVITGAIIGLVYLFVCIIFYVALNSLFNNYYDA